MALAWAAAGWAAGLALGPTAGLPVLSWLILTVAAGAFAFVFRRTYVYPWVFGLLAVGFMGALRTQAALPHPTASSLKSFNDIPIPLTIRGVVIGLPVVRGRTVRAMLRAEEVARGQDGPYLQIDGLLQMETTEAIGLGYGDRLLVNGWLATPRNTPSFAQAEILARDGVFSVLRTLRVVRLGVDQADPILGFFYRVRQRALQALAASLPPEEAALVGGVVLGADESMPPHLQQVFSRTGTTHILAVSGFNVALVAGAFGTLFGRWLGARRGALAAAVAIGCYTILVGAEPSAVRAAVMAGLAMTARLMGRRGNALTSLAATGVIMTAVRPSLLAEIGFQLSFAATLGLVLYAEPLEHAALAWFQPAAARSAPGIVAIVREVILLTLAAQMATLPLTAYYFGRLPATALPANFLILPVQPALMILGSLTAVAGMAWPPAGYLLGWITYPLASYNLRVVEGFARLPLASLSVGPLSPWGVLVSYGFLIALAAALHARKNGRELPSFLPAWGRLAASAIVAALVWRAALDSPDSHLHATLFSSGDVLVESPTGRFILLRPASGSVLPAGDIGRRLPLMESALDWMLLPTSDSAQGYLASRPGQRLIPLGVLYAGDEPDLSALTGIGASPPSQGAYPNLRLDMGDGSELEVVVISEQGAAVLVSMDRAKVLILLGLAYNELGPAAPTEPTAVLADGAGRVDGILEAGLVGGAGSALDPPAGLPVLDTDHHGWIAIETDGVQLWAETER